MKNKPFIVARHVGARFDNANAAPLLALDDVNLHVHRGEFYCVLGPSGCGKSTLLHLLAGFLAPSSGTVEIDGKPVHNPNPHYVTVFQDPGVFEWRTVLGNVAFGLEVQGVPAARAHAAARQYLGLVGLGAFETALPAELSGGMKQRVSLARALAVQPKALFMDEPFGALDELTRMKMQDELARIWRQTGTTIVFVTHSVDEAVHLGTRVALFTPRPGRILKTYELPPHHDRPARARRVDDIKRRIYRDLGIQPR